MKIGMRRPSLKRSISARTIGRLNRSIKRAVIPGYGRRGMGILHPKKALYNRVYRRTTFSIFDLLGSSSSGNRRSSANNSGCCLVFLFLIGIIAFFTACSQSSQSDQSSSQTSEYSSEYSYGSQSSNSNVPSDTAVNATMKSNTRISNYSYEPDPEDAYEEGVAQAEEDRLAGHPGANYANDYDDDDENDAYEEGYEDE
jgi:hypothetical protein